MFDWSNSLFESSKTPDSLVNSVTGQACSIRFAKVNNKEYVFIVSLEEIDKSLILKELVAYLSDDVLLEYPSSEIIAVHFNQFGKQQYRRFSLAWTEIGAQLVRPKERNPASKAEFLNALFNSSISVEDFEEIE